MKHLRTLTRAAWIVLAVVDLVLLAVLAARYGWGFELPRDAPTPAGWLVLLLVGALVLAEKLFVAAALGLVAIGILRELRRTSRPVPVLAVFASLLLAAALLGVALLWVSTAGAIVAQAGPFLDRLTMFEGLARRPSGTELSGLASYQRGSVGTYLVTLLGPAYLFEKYLLACWGIRWPLPLLPLAAVSWLTLTVVKGEQRSATGYRDSSGMPSPSRPPGPRHSWPARASVQAGDCRGGRSWRSF